MEKLDVANLNSIALDWAIAHCEGFTILLDPMGFKVGSEAGYWIWEQEGHRLVMNAMIGDSYSPTTKYQTAGPIITRERISCSASTTTSGWTAYIAGTSIKHAGDTMLMAAMRCYVEKTLGAVIDVPRMLIEC